MGKKVLEIEVRIRKILMMTGLKMDQEMGPGTDPEVNKKIDIKYDKRYSL